MVARFWAGGPGHWRAFATTSSSLPSVPCWPGPPFSAPSWGLLGCGLPPRHGCVVFEVLPVRPLALLLLLPCPLLGPSAVAPPSQSDCCCSYRHGISVCTSAHSELVPLHTDPSLSAALLLFGRAPHVASAFLRLAGVLRPADLASQCSRMEPAKFVPQLPLWHLSTRALDRTFCQCSRLEPFAA